MPRIRTIKPEMWGDEKLSVLPVIDRLVFVALISLADDAGRLLDSVKWLDGVLFLNTEDTSGTSLGSLASAGRIVRGVTASGQRIIQIVNWSKHQRVDHPNLKSSLPEILIPQEVAGIRETFPRDSRAIPASTYDLRPVPTTDDDDHGVPASVVTAAGIYLHDPTSRTARLGILRSLSQGMTGLPVSEAAMVRGLEDMAVAGAEFRPVVVRSWCQRAVRLLEGEAGQRAAEASKTVLGHPRGNQPPSGSVTEGFAEDEVA